LFWRFVTDRPLLDVAGAAVVLALACAEIAVPWLLQNGVDAATGWPTAWPLPAVSLVLAAMLALIVGLRAAALLIETWLFSGASFELRRQLYGHLLHLPLAEVSRHRSGTLTRRSVRDVAAFEAGVAELFAHLLYDVLVGLGAVVAMALIDLRLTAVVVTVMAVASIATGHLGRSMPVMARATQMLGARLARRLHDALGATRTMRALGGEARELVRLDAINRRILATERTDGRRRAIAKPLRHLAEAVGLVAILAYGRDLLATHTISAGALVGVIAYMELLAGPIRRFGGTFARFRYCRRMAERIARLLRSGAPDLPSGTRRGSGADIAFSQVGFRYPGTDRSALRGVSFSVGEGQHAALVGRAGAGKSTLFDLLLRLYQPDEGCVAAGGVDLAAWDVVAWRRSVGFVSRETVLFQGTLAENVAYGRPDADREAIIRALGDAGAGDLLARLPRGLDTLVGEPGVELSNCERQIVGLARLFLRDPRIVLLDEPTWGLEGAALQTVDAALERLLRGRTALLITDQPETLRLAQRVVLMDAGRVVAVGTHAQMTATQPLFRRLFGEVAQLSSSSMVA
jgi:ABC-type multidrug transport system fused ATPase/permease subunit